MTLKTNPDSSIKNPASRIQKRPFINWRYFLVWIGDAVVVVISIYFAILIYNFLGPFIGRDPLSKEVIEYISESVWKIILFYSIPLYIMGIIERFRDERSGIKGYILIAFTVLFGVACMTYWIKKGLSIKTFSILFLISLLGSSFFWRFKILPFLLEKREEITEHIPPRIQDYFRVKPSAPFIIEKREKIISRILPRIQDYFRVKPSAPFIIGFIVLLIISAFLLIFKKEPSAESVANWAYLLLVIGVVIELVQSIRKKENRD